MYLSESSDISFSEVNNATVYANVTVKNFCLFVFAFHFIFHGHGEGRGWRRNDMQEAATACHKTEHIVL